MNTPTLVSIEEKNGVKTFLYSDGSFSCYALDTSAMMEDFIRHLPGGATEEI